MAADNGIGMTDAELSFGRLLVAEHRFDNVTDGFRYPLSAENNLVNYIENGYYVQAKYALGQFFGAVSDANENEKLLTCAGIIIRLTKLVYENQSIPPSRRAALAAKATAVFDGKFDFDTVRCKAEELVHDLCAVRQPLAYQLPPLVIKTQNIVARYYNNPNLNVSMVGEKLGVSGYYASKRFKKCTGISLTDYICRVRVERAKWLMTNANLNLTDIARRVGLNDARALNIVFKKVEGMAPSVCRSLSRDI